MNFQKICIWSSVFIFLVYAGLMAALSSFFSLEKMIDIMTAERTLYAVKLSLLSATLVTFFSMLLAVPAAFALSRYDFPGKRMVDTVLELPLFVSPAALGAMILIFFNTSVGIWLQGNIKQFVFTVYGVLLAQLVAVMGVSVRLVKAVFDQIPVRYENVARTLGASAGKAFFTVTLPNAYKGLLAAMILTWAKAIGEFGATVTVAGTIALKTETLPISIYMRLATADIEGAVASIIILIGISILVLYLSRFLLAGDGYAGN